MIIFLGTYNYAITLPKQGDDLLRFVFLIIIIMLLSVFIFPGHECYQIS